MKKILVYVLLTFAITWSLDWAISLNASNITDVATAQLAQLAVAGTMLVPLIGALLTKLILRKKEKISLKVKPNFKGNIKYYFMAWFGPAILTLIGSLVFFLINPSLFDVNFGTFRKTAEYAISSGAITADMIPTVLLSQLISAILIAPFFNAIFAFGEEAGWRGLLFPALCEKLSTRKAIIVTGVIWGLWHAPLTAMGHNYGFGYFGYPWTGILAMCSFCIVIGCSLSYLTVKTNSVWPAALAHGGLNAIASAGIYFTASAENLNPFVGPAGTGIIGGIGFIIFAIICYIKLGKKEEKVTNE